MLGVTSELGYPSLSITYRNDPGAPASADGRYRYGRDEWQEVEGAVRHALAQGARDVVLVGYSMGGGIVTNFLYQSPLAATGRGLVLDSPLLDLGATFRLRAQDRGLPQFMARIGQQIARARFGVDWGELDYLRRADELRVPILLFHGDADRGSAGGDERGPGRRPAGPGDLCAGRRGPARARLEPGAAAVRGGGAGVSGAGRALAVKRERRGRGRGLRGPRPRPAAAKRPQAR